jgi:hypothetical protein
VVLNTNSIGSGSDSDRTLDIAIEAAGSPEGLLRKLGKSLLTNGVVGDDGSITKGLK